MTGRMSMTKQLMKCEIWSVQPQLGWYIAWCSCICCSQNDVKAFSIMDAIIFEITGVRSISRHFSQTLLTLFLNIGINVESLQHSGTHLVVHNEVIKSVIDANNVSPLSLYRAKLISSVQPDLFCHRCWISRRTSKWERNSTVTAQVWWTNHSFGSVD
jgi:hypothetical protein